MSYTPTWTALVSLISADVVLRLAAEGMPPLTPEIDGSAGKIQIGPQFVSEAGSPPRILFVPRGFDMETAPGRNVTSRGPTNGDYTAELQTRAIARQWKRYEVQCWGCNFSDQATPAPDPALDFDAAQALAEIVWQSCQSLAAGRWRTVRGEIDPGAPTLDRLGRVFTFDVSLDTPVLDTATTFAPSNVAPNPTTNLSVNGTAQIGCQG